MYFPEIKSTSMDLSELCCRDLSIRLNGLKRFEKKSKTLGDLLKKKKDTLFFIIMPSIGLGLESERPPNIDFLHLPK